MAIALLALLMVAQEPSSPPAPKPKLVCRGGESQLGSHVHAQRRCLTEEQWQEEDARRDRVPVTLRVTGDQGDGQPTRSRPE